MRSVQFKQITIRNFLSVGDNPLTISFQKGVNVITGINYDIEDSRNGVGKSVIVDAIYFALFGTTIRDLCKELITNSINKKDCEVILEISLSDSSTSSEYIIRRTINPTKCYVTKNGEDVTRSTLPKTNEYVQRLINSTGKVFQNSVIMTANNTIPFMAQSKIDKRKFIENILNLEVFSEMLNRAREEYNDKRRAYEVLYSKKAILTKSHDLNKQQLELFGFNKQKRLDDIDLKIGTNADTIKSLEKTIIEIPSNAVSLFEAKEAKLLTDLEAKEIKHEEILKQNITIKARRDDAKKQLRDLEKIGAKCLACNRLYAEEDINHKDQSKKEIDKLIAELEQEVLFLNVDLSQAGMDKAMAATEIKNLATKKQKIQDLISTNKNIQSKIAYIKEANETLAQDRISIEKESNDTLEKVVRENDATLVEYNTDLERINKDLDILDCVKFVVSEEGVKTYIVKKILKILNARLGYYIQKLETNCSCHFNEYFDEVIVDERSEAKSYFNFSGGERKRIDLACLFAFLDIRRMQGDITFNTTFYDELLDSSLDDRGVELVIDILRERVDTYNENCYIITHRGNTVSSRVDNIVNIQKKSGFTSLAPVP